MTNFILATAGHVDHGKSALVKALTGTDPDRLPEEKARGITIDLGFAELNLSGPNGEKFHVGIVDVPGHEDFVRNMIAGAGSIDLALLAVAADDLWMPQTEEHLQILTYLGVKRIVVALTKSDLGKINVATQQILEQLRETSFADSAIVPTSVRTGDGIEKLKSVLVSEFSALPPPRDIGKARLFVDRSFTLKGIGTVVTGTLTGGVLRVGETVLVQPRGVSTRIRSLQSHGRDVHLVEPGTRTAINLPDLQAGADVKRGDLIATQQFEPSSTLDVLLTCSVRSKRGVPIKSRSSAWIHHGTTSVLGKILFVERDSVGSGQSAVTQLRLTAPLLAFVGDRLIIRDASEQQTLAGAVVFNIGPEEVRSSRQRALLATRTVAPDDIALAVWTEISSKGVIEPARLLVRSRFSAEEIGRALQRLSDDKEIFLSPKVGAKMLVWREFGEQLARVIDATHKEHPERRGVELNALRAEFSSLSPPVFDELIVDLCQRDFVQVASAIARKSHRASLPPELKDAADKLRAAMEAKPFDPPARKELAQNRHQQQALTFLIEQGEIVQVSEEVVLLRESLEKMQTVVLDFISTDGPATASQLRVKIGTSRRVIIPFLEYLDRTRLTRRVGDQRLLAQKASAAKVTDAATAPQT
jgi:selenocysteine-specific elongation factor